MKSKTDRVMETNNTRGVVLCVGELLVDMIAQERGTIQSAESFRKYPGGSAGNVAVGVVRLGGQAAIITKLGPDRFGDYLEDVMRSYGVDTSAILRDSYRRTSLAFVSLDDNRIPDYAFYRHPSASIYLQTDEFPYQKVNAARLIYTSSMSIVSNPFRQTMHRVATFARKNRVPVAFDVNLRLSLWKDADEARREIFRFLRKVNILKINTEELEFLYPVLSEADRADKLLAEIPAIQLLTVTLGSQGVCLYTRSDNVTVPAVPLEPHQLIDTTGAGDAFMAALISRLEITGQGALRLPDIDSMLEIGRFANAAAALAVQRPGVIPALPELSEIESLLQTRL